MDDADGLPPMEQMGESEELGNYFNDDDDIDEVPVAPAVVPAVAIASEPYAVPYPEDSKLVTTDSEKAERRKERNRESAKESRKRAKAHMDTLEAERDELRAAVATLTNENYALLCENARLSGAPAPAPPVLVTEASPKPATAPPTPPLVVVAQPLEQTVFAAAPTTEAVASSIVDDFTRAPSPPWDAAAEEAVAAAGLATPPVLLTGSGGNAMLMPSFTTLLPCAPEYTPEAVLSA